jgi:drug/metabolite transporter (DMT)-like permease
LAIAIFALSGVTATLCSVLLLRGYLRNGVRLLFWAGICFAALALEGVVLVINEYVATDLTVLRLSVPLAGLVALLYGLLWESDAR